MSEDQFPTSLRQTMKDIWDIQTSLWVSDFDSASERISTLIKRLEDYSSEMTKAADEFSKERKKLERIGVVEARLQLGKRLRKRKVRMDLLIGEAILKIAKRYQSYTEDVRRWQEVEGYRVSRREFGYTYVVYEVGTGRYELRALRASQRPLSDKTVDLLASAFVTGGGTHPPLDILERATDKDHSMPYFIKLRLFLEGSTVDISLFDDQTVFADILTREGAMAESIARVIVSALSR